MKLPVKYTSTIAIGTLALLALASCKKVNFGDTNSNPNPNVFLVGNTQELLTNAQTYSWGDYTIATTGTVKEPVLYIQYLSQSQYPDAGLYNNTQPSWSNWYAVPLEDLKQIIEANAAKSKGAEGNGSTANQIATARIFKAYLFSILTDRYGDIPYSQALIAGNVNPAYDKQQAIYSDLFKELREAVAQFDGGEQVKGDVIYDGNVAKWKKFANSLRMILALRLSKVDPATGKSEFVAAYNDPAGYINTNADNAVFNYLNTTTYRSPWNSLYNQRSDYGVSTTMINTLQSFNDLRLTSYAHPINSGTAYKGVPPGLNTTNLAAWINANPDYSRMSSKITGWNWSGSIASLQSYKGTNNGYIVTAAQMLLTKAEAEMLGWVGTIAEVPTDYTNAIKASWDQYGVTYTTAQFNTYMAGASVAPSTTATTMLSRIGTQKWLALYPNGQEAWSEWRRTGYPSLTPAPNAVSTSPGIPRRLTYPSTEVTLNATNYSAQAASMSGGDTQSARVWWDKP